MWGLHSYWAYTYLSWEDMTTTYATDQGAMWRALHDWLWQYAGLDSSKVRRLNQAAGRPDLPYATMQVLSDIGGGVEGELQEYNVANDDLASVTYGPRRMTMQITVYTAVEQTPDDLNTGNAVSRLTAAVHALRTPAVKASFKSNGVAFMQQLASIQAGDEQLGQRWERRATVDLEFSYTAYTTVIGENGAPLASVSAITEEAGTLTIQE